MGKSTFGRWLVNRAGLVLVGLMAAGILPLGVSAQPLAVSEDAVTAARFSITIDGVQIASFKELAGMTTEARPPTLTFKRGMSQSVELWAWHEAALQGNIVAARKPAGLVMYDSDGKPVARYHLDNAWPAKIELGGLKAGSNEAPMETVTIVAERIQRVSP